MEFKGDKHLDDSDMPRRIVLQPQTDPDRPDGLHANWHHACVAGPAFMFLYLKNRGLEKKFAADYLKGVAAMFARESGGSDALLAGFDAAIDAAVAEQNADTARRQLEDVFTAMYGAAPKDFDWSKAG